MADLETLSISIKAKADSAYKSIEKLALSLDKLSVSIAKIETGKLNNLASELDSLNMVISNMGGKSSTYEFNRIAKNINSLANVNSSGLNNLATSLGVVSNAINNISITDTVTENVKQFATTIGKLGYKGIGNAINNLPQLESAISSLFTTFSQVPAINQNVIDFINSITNLASQGQHTGSAINGIDNALERFGTTTQRVSRRTHSLSSMIGKLYARFWLFMRGATALKNSFRSAADYLEAFNYFDVTARKIGKDTFSKAGVGSAEEYAEAFTETLQEKLHKMSGLELDLEQRLIKTTNAKSLGLNLTELTQYQASIASITNAMGNSQEIAQSTAKAFSMLAGDMSSLKNLDFEQVSQNLQSALTGQARALYRYGIDLTSATLEQYAYANGITKSVSEMTQAEKAQLRLLAILDQSKVAWGDLANTINSPSNQLRMLQNNLKETGTVFGQLFIPIMSSALPVINGLSMAIKQLLVDIAELLGIKLNLDSFGQFGEDINADIESMDELNAAVKETKKSIRDFDELKVISDNKKGGTGVGDQIDLTKQIVDATAEYEKVWDEAYQRMTSKASEIAGYISGAFEPIKRIIQDFHVGDFLKAGEDVSQLVVSIFDFVSDAIDSVDWKALGNKVGSFLEGIDWVEILKSLGGLLANAIQAAIDLWWGSFTAAPFETAIMTAFAIMQFTGLGDKITSQLSKQIVNSLGGNKAAAKLKDKLAQAGVGVIALGLGVSLTIDNVASIKAGEYSSGDLQAMFKAAMSSILSGAGIGFLAKSLGFAAGGLTFGVIGGIASLAVNLAVLYANLETPYEAARKVHAAELEWVDEYNLDAMKVETSIELRGTITAESLSNIDDLSEKIWDLSQNFEKLTDEEKGQLKKYSDELLELIPGAKSMINEMTGAVKGTADEWQRIIDLEKEEIRLNAYKQNLQEVKDAQASTESVYLDLEKELKETREQRENILQSFKDTFGEEKGLEYYNKVLEDISKGLNPDINSGYQGSAIGFSLTGQKDVQDLIEQLSDSVAYEDELNEKIKETDKVMESLAKDFEYWDSRVLEEYTHIQKESVESTEETIKAAKKIVEEHKLPKAVESTLTKVNNQIKHNDPITKANMNNLFNSVNEAFEGLEDGKPPAEIQAMLDNIKEAIINNSPELELLMAQLAIKMENAFSNALQTKDGNLLWNKNNISKRLDTDFNKVEEALHNNARPGTKTLEKDLLELFGVDAADKLPKSVNEGLKKVAQTIEKGEGKQAVMDALDGLKSSTLLEAEKLGMYLEWGTAGGIYEGKYLVEEATSDMVHSGFEDTYMEESESRSPSRLARRLAKYLPEGAALGIEDGIPTFDNAVKSLVNSFKDVWGNIQYYVPDLGLGSVNSQSGFNYGSMDSDNGFMSQMLKMANMGESGSQTEVVFRVEGDPYGIFKVVREENDRYRNRTHRSAFN